MTIVRKLSDGWLNWWFTPIPPYIYALLRITLGTAACIVYLYRSDVGALWDPTGLVRTDAGASAIKQWLVAHALGGLAGVALFSGCLAILVAMTVGLYSRITVPLALAVTFVQLRWNPLPTTGADNVLRALLFCLMWTDAGRVWSLDAWRSGLQRTLPPAGAIAPLRLMRFQIALIYFSAALHKLASPSWRDGSAVYYVLNSNVHQRFGYFVPSNLEWLATTATYLTVFWELSFALLILLPIGRAVAIWLGVLIHLGMFALMEVGPFHLVMLASYPAFLRPDTVERLARRFGALPIPDAKGQSSIAESRPSSV